MADIALSPAPQERTPARVSIEALIYLSVLLLAVLVRLPGLDAAPLDDLQARDALAAYDRVRLVDEGALYPDNPLASPVRMLFFTLAGPTDLAARLPDALAGALLTLAPLLYRREIGRWGALALALGLAMSPVAVLASREMSGMVWALGLLLVAGRFALDFAREGDRGAALAASVCLAGVVFLTTPFGVLLALGAFFGLAAGVLGAEATTRGHIAGRLAAWPWFESLLAGALSIAAVATVLFIFPSGLSGVAGLPERFAEALVAQAEAPTLYPLLVALRYDALFVLFGALGLVTILRDDATFLERFFAGWYAWAVLGMLLYGGTGPDLALLLTLPALGLTISFFFRLLATTSYGYWHVPGWVLPIHALAVAALLVGLATNLNNVFGKLADEARPIDLAKVLTPASGDDVRISTIRQNVGDVSLAATLPQMLLENCQAGIGDRDPDALEIDATGRYCDPRRLTDYTLQLISIDADAQQAELEILGPSRAVVATSEGSIQGGVRVFFQAEDSGDYRFNLLYPEDYVPQDDAQVLAILHRGDATAGNLLDRLGDGTWTADIPALYAGFQVMTRAPVPTAPVGVLGILLSIPVTFFLVGAFYGARAAWRGVLLGALLFGGVYGLGLALGAGGIHAEDPRELWHREPPQDDYQNLDAILTEYSLRDTGMPYLLDMTVQGRRDSALGWALRRFENAQYVPTLTPQTDSPAVIAPDVLRPSLAQDYVGQSVLLGRDWSRHSLAWVDVGAWLFNNQTRFAPEDSQVYRVWIASELYDVMNVPNQE